VSNYLSATICVVAALVVTGPTGGQDVAEVQAAPATIRGAERYSLRARSVDETYQIDVLAVVSPLRPLAPGEKLSVVFVLDGSSYFPLVASTATLLSLENAIPSTLLVGVGYDLDPALSPGARMLEVLARRNRDYTPSLDEAFVKEMNDMYAQVGSTYPAYGRPGGADAFLAFLNEELKPFIAQRYPNADTNDSAIVGHSFGGLFALHVLFTAPESFDRYVAGSPSPWWGDGALFASEAAPVLDIDARLFLSFGELETEDRMRNPVRRLDSLLRDGRRSKLTYTLHTFADETHGSVVPATFSRGLREVFER
jgi:predicted alpha/beta superfamily hydrolase